MRDEPGEQLRLDKSIKLRTIESFFLRTIDCVNLNILIITNNDKVIVHTQN